MEFLDLEVDDGSLIVVKKWFDDGYVFFVIVYRADNFKLDFCILYFMVRVYVVDMEIG